MNANITSVLTYLGLKKKKTFRQKLMAMDKKKLLSYSLAGVALAYAASKFGVPQVARVLSRR